MTFILSIRIFLTFKSILYLCLKDKGKVKSRLFLPLLLFLFCIKPLEDKSEIESSKIKNDYYKMKIT